MNATIVTLPGDGVGPEVTAEAARVLRVIASGFGHRFEFAEHVFGGAAIDATGEPLPAPTLEACVAADAVLLGAVGGPRWSDPSAQVRPEQGLLGLRRALKVHANLRPIRPIPDLVDASPIRSERLDGVDLVFVRELTGGIYFGEKESGGATPERWASDACVYTEDEVARVVRLAASMARSRRGKLTSVDKANVLETSRLWRAVTTEIVRAEFPDVVLEHILVDACAMHLIRRPADFDVIVTENLFGDILTDEASMLVGSIGLLPSASLGAGAAATRAGLYEPIHGSAPDIAGRGLANPIGAILSAALLLRHSLGLEAEAAAVESAVAATIRDGLRTVDLAAGSPVTTAEMGQAVATRVERAVASVGAAASDAEG